MSQEATRLMTNRKAELTFQHNMQQGRHGWLRLTPAYSIKVVHELLDLNPHALHVLDPFSGTGTTGLVCAERGLRCDLLDINPFLVWLARLKTTNFTDEQLHQAENTAREVISQVERKEQVELWLPPIADIDRWWSGSRQILLARLRRAIDDLLPRPAPAKDLLLIAFCRVLIEWSNAAFNHQSMSFKTSQATLFDFDPENELLHQFRKAVDLILDSACLSVSGEVNVLQIDARQVPEPVGGLYDCVITSPPYPNRMSYIRELRPYMYWLKYLNEARDAGELDWQAIGGTWGIATSRISKWQSDDRRVPHSEFLGMIEAVARKSQTLANYIHKYFIDIVSHIYSLYPQLSRGSNIYYIVGNSKFYDTLIPVEQIYASILQKTGFTNVEVKRLRKRNSKKELYEFVVCGQKP